MRFLLLFPQESKFCLFGKTHKSFQFKVLLREGRKTQRNFIFVFANFKSSSKEVFQRIFALCDAEKLQD